MTGRPRCTATTAKGKPCKLTAVEGADVCAVHAGAKVGRPSKLDGYVIERMVQVLKAGGHVETAAAASGVSKQAFYDWLDRGDPDGTAPENEPYREFRAKIELARGEGEARNVAIIAQAAPENWQAARFLLQSQYPERWGKPGATVIAPPTEKKPHGDDETKPEDAFDALDRGEVVTLASRRKRRAS